MKNRGEFREVGHRVVDMLSEYLEHIEEKPVFPNVELLLADTTLLQSRPGIPTPRRKCCCKNWKRSFFRIARMWGTRVTWG